jgi:hypothetical protein
VVDLKKDGRGWQFTVHRLGAQTFLDSDVFRPDTDHLADVTRHHGVTNLEYVSRRENPVRGFVVRVRLRNAGRSTRPISYGAPPVAGSAVTAQADDLVQDPQVQGHS